MKIIKMFKKIMEQIKINNIVYNERSSTIQIINNKVMINGRDVTPDDKVINIEITGNVDKLLVDACQSITVSENVNDISTMSGSVEVSGDVKRNINTMSGSVRVGGKVGGTVSTMSGNIKTN